MTGSNTPAPTGTTAKEGGLLTEEEVRLLSSATQLRDILGWYPAAHRDPL